MHCSAYNHSPVKAGAARLCLLILAAVLTACAGEPSRELLAQRIAAAPESEIAATHQIFVATTRTRAEDPRAVFDGGRAGKLTFARVDMSVPKSHVPGEIERPVSYGLADPAKYFTALRIAGYRDDEAFAAALRKQFAAHDGHVMVFVHGYNTSFDSAVYRMTQIVHDSGFKGAAVLFSWPSAGRTLDYVYDSNSASTARDALERTLRLIAGAGASRVDLVAHSMGSWVAVEALRQLAMTGHRDLDGRLGDVVLASPDIDVDVFKSEMRRYGKPDEPFYILTSDNDRALRVSGLIAGRQPRVGDYHDAADLAAYGVTVVDVTSLSAGDRLNHTKFAQNPLLIKLLGQGLTDEIADAETQDDITKRINALAQGIGQTIGSAAEIIVTTPAEVLNIAVGGAMRPR